MCNPTFSTLTSGNAFAGSVLADDTGAATGPVEWGAGAVSTMAGLETGAAGPIGAGPSLGCAASGGVSRAGHGAFACSQGGHVAQAGTTARAPKPKTTSKAKRRLISR
jgi:hypothetical protein